MRVPINPQTNVPTGQLGYEKAVDITAGARALAQVVDKYAEVAAQDEKKRELFDVQKLLVDETNNIQTDFDAKKTVEPLGAPNFVQRVNGEYNTRHAQMVQGLKDRGYSDDAVNEFATRLGTIRSQYVAQAIDFQDKSNFAKRLGDADEMVTSLSQHANKNPNAVGSALDEYRVSLQHLGLDAVEQEKLYQSGKGTIVKAAQEGLTNQNPDLILRLFDPQHTITSPATSPDGSTTVIPTQAIKPSGQLADNIVAGLKNRGLSDAQARGVAAGIASESANNATAFNKEGGGKGAFGLGQWRGARQAALFKQFGKNPSGSQQLDFLVAELNGGDAGGKAVLSQADEVGVLHSYIQDFMRPSENGARGDIKRGLAALGRKVAEHAEVTEAQLRQPVTGRSYSQEDAIQELGMTAEQAKVFVDTGQDTRQVIVAAQPTPDLVDANGRTGIPAIDLASGPERMEMLQRAHTILNQRNEETKAANREAHDTWYNQFLNELQDGTIGQVELNQAYQGGQITDFDERAKAQAIIDSKNKKDDDIVLFGAMLNSGVKGNPYSNEQQKAVDVGFEAGIKDIVKNKKDISPFDYALHLWERTGIMPKQGAVMIRGGLVGTDPQQVAGAASVANNMIRQNPNAFAGVEGQAEIEHAAVAYGHYIYDLGMSPQDASMKVAQENDPKFKEKFKYNDPATQEILKTLRQTGVNATQSFKGAQFANQDALNEGNQTYYELLRDQLNRGLDFGAATAQVDAQMQKVYGVNSTGRVVKYPPERAYPTVNGSWDYVYKDAQKTVKDETGRDPIHVNLVPIPGVTDEDFRQGRQARYRIIYNYKAGDGQTVVDSVPGEFAADVTTANKEASEKNRKEFVKAREAQINRGAPVFFPGIGEVR